MQTAIRSIGFLSMQEEPGEKRAFLPNFIQKLTEIGYEAVIEEGYGAALGLELGHYQKGNPKVSAASREAVFQQDVALILRAPHDAELSLLGEKTILISMLHYPTHPIRRSILKEKKIRAISLDSITDDFGVRLVENMKAVGWNGLEAAFDELEKQHAALIHPRGRPWHVCVLGSGMVGRHAVDAATKFGGRARNQHHMEVGGRGVHVRVVGRNLSSDKDCMLKIFNTCDVLVDATQRDDPSVPIIPNEWLAALPQNAIIVDLSVDPYTPNADPPVVKGIEGIPQGNLDQYVFETDDPAWEQIPDTISAKNRRKTVSCYSWPGIHPKACMHRYGQQLLPLMRVLQRKGYDELSERGAYFERALWRAKLETFLEKNPKQPHKSTHSGLTHKF